MARRYAVDVPEGESGDWKVERYTISEKAAKFDAVRSIFSSGSCGRFVPAGTYTKLTCSDRMVMSDTPDEIRDFMGFVHRARGRVLIHGLGLGVCAAAVLGKEEVTHLKVVEISPDVIKLVGPWLTELAKKEGKSLEIIEGDCFTWKPNKGERWNVVWHDVWNDLCTDNLEEMATMHRRFGRRCDWQGSWGRELLQDQRRRDKAQGWW